MSYQVVLVGSSGLIGSHLLSILIESQKISKILLVLRKSLNISDPKVQELIINFDELESFSTDIKGDIIYSCLGTTKAATPDPDLYRKIDLEYPSLLTGNRRESRLSEKFAISVFKLIDPLLIGPLKKYHSIKAETVAQAMLNQSLKELKGTFIYPSIQIQELA